MELQIHFPIAWWRIFIIERVSRIRFKRFGSTRPTRPIALDSGWRGWVPPSLTIWAALKVKARVADSTGKPLTQAFEHVEGDTLDYGIRTVLVERQTMRPIGTAGGDDGAAVRCRASINP